MTGSAGDGAIILFVVFPHHLKLCGAIQNFACFPKALPLVVVLSLPKALPFVVSSFPRRCHWARVY